LKRCGNSPRDFDGLIRRVEAGHVPAEPREPRSVASHSHPDIVQIADLLKPGTALGQM